MGRRYLIIKTSSLGDVVQTLPVLSLLKMAEPDCTIDWVVERGAAGMLRACMQLDNVIEVDTKKWRKFFYSPSTWTDLRQLRLQLQQHTYDIVFDLQGNTKSALFTWLSRSTTKGGFGKKTVPEWPNLLFTNKKIELPEGLNISEDYLWVVSHLLNQSMPSALPPVSFTVDANEVSLVNSICAKAVTPILLAPGSAWENKRLSKEQLVKVLSQCSKEQTVFLSWGSEAEKTLCESLISSHPQAVVLPKLSLQALQLLMSKMSLVISMDSLPLHLAASTGAPTYSFFGPSSALKYAPRGPQHRHVQGPCPYGKTFTKRCPILRTCPTGACIKQDVGQGLQDNTQLTG